MMASEHLIVDDDDEEWPDLVVANNTNNQNRVMDASVTRVIPATTKQHGTEHEDWEMLHPESSSNSSATTDILSPNSHTSFEIVEDDSEDEYHVATTKPVNDRRRHLRHCMSSPNLTGSGNPNTIIPYLDAVAEEPIHDDDAFSLIDGPASVMTASTTMTVSFRDAILASSSTAPHPTIASAATKSLPNGDLTLRQQQQRSRLQSKLIVVSSPLGKRRNSKSTGDLQSLCKATTDWFDEDDDGDGGAAGRHCDTMEFYHRKTLGSNSRTNGLKLRPDEARRRDIILIKKKEQQLRQQQRQSLNPTKTTTSRVRSR